MAFLIDELSLGL